MPDPNKKPSKASSGAAKQLGSKGGKVGGVNRAKKLTSQQRSEVASKGGKAKASKNKGKKKKP